MPEDSVGFIELESKLKKKNEKLSKISAYIKSMIIEHPSFLETSAKNKISVRLETLCKIWRMC